MDSTLRALYAVSSGAVVGQVTVSRARTDLVDRMASLAARLELSGPLLRVGDRAARLDWRGPGGGVYPLLIPRIADVLRAPETLQVFALPTAASLLDSAFPSP